MLIQSLHIGMEVRHPQYGVGVVKALTELTADISFNDARRTIAPASSELTPAEPTAGVSELQVPLSNFIRETAHAVVEALGLEKGKQTGSRLKIFDICTRADVRELSASPPRVCPTADKANSSS
jgi:hypothetical protein